MVLIKISNPGKQQKESKAIANLEEGGSGELTKLKLNVQFSKSKHYLKSAKSGGGFVG